MSQAAIQAQAGSTGPAASRSRLTVVSAIGVAQILAWGSSYYLLAVLAGPIASDTGWPLTWIMGALSIGMLVSGLASPRIGHLIDRHGGRPVLAASAVLLSAGLLLLGLAPSLPVFVLAWVILGLAMGAGLYDPAFSTLGRLYGEQARSAITHVTLFGGFASTVCWPLTALAVEDVGWRSACFAYAAAQVFVMAPALFLLLPREARKAPATTERAGAGTMSLRDRRTFWLLAAILMANGAVQTTVSVHLLTILQDQGMALAAAVAVGALIGPSQVGARVVEMLVGDRLHPTATLACAGALVAVGMALLALGAGPAAVAVVLYAAGNGVWSIARGTVPLALFGPERYPVVMGGLAAPNLVVQAAAPFAAGFAISAAGTHATLGVLATLALANLLATIALARSR